MHGDGLPFRSLGNSAARFLNWWRDELWDLVPESGRRLMTRAGPSVVLAEVEGGFQVLTAEADGARSGPTSETLAQGQALQLLATIARKGGGAIARVRVPVSRCYSRRMELPKAARGDARRILNLDLERVTPFRLKDVYTAHVEEGTGAGGKTWVRQFVAKREAIDSLIAGVRSCGFDVAFVDCWEKDPSIGLPLNLLEPEASTRSSGVGRFVTPVRALMATAIILLLSSVVLTVWRNEAALAEIRAETSKTRERAASVREMLDRADATVGDLTRLQHLKLTRIPALDVLEELSRVLPDSVWLSEFRLEVDGLDISGLAKSGAALPPLFAQSAIFTDAALTAPLTLDPREDKERFSLRVRIKQPQEAAEKAPKR
jgi:general secretion pathway protein L